MDMHNKSAIALFVGTEERKDCREEDSNGLFKIGMHEIL